MKEHSIEERLEKSISEKQATKERLVNDLICTAGFTFLAIAFGTNFGIHLSQKTGTIARYLIDLGAISVSTWGALYYSTSAQEDTQELKLHDAAIAEISKKVK